MAVQVFTSKRKRRMVSSASAVPTARPAPDIVPDVPEIAAQIIISKAIEPSPLSQRRFSERRSAFVNFYLIFNSISSFYAILNLIGGVPVRILLIEDEKRMAQALCELLRLEKYEVDHFANGLDGLAAIESGIYDIVILDVMLPGMNGYDITKMVRSKGIGTPILMLTAKAELDDKVTGLDSGADDYLTKPFMTRELLARLRALGRRTLGAADGVLSFGDIALDTAALTLFCTRNGQSVRLSEKEYHILEYFIANAGQVLTREQLALKIWGFDSEAEYNNVEVYMSFTRRKLSFVGSGTEIKADRGVGYELRGEGV